MRQEALVIKWQALARSSHIKQAAYLTEHAILLIEFTNGSIYGYPYAPETLYKSFIEAASPGSYAHNNIYYRALPMDFVNGLKKGSIIFGTCLQDPEEPPLHGPERLRRKVFADSLNWFDEINEGFEVKEYETMAHS